MNHKTYIPYNKLFTVTSSSHTHINISICKHVYNIKIILLCLYNIYCHLKPYSVQTSSSQHSSWFTYSVTNHHELLTFTKYIRPYKIELYADTPYQP